jgi:hypothetical protein
MSYLHLSAVRPGLSVGEHSHAGDTIGWSGGCTQASQYTGTSNPTGHNFLDTPDQSSQPQTGIALMYGPEYGVGAGWTPKPDPALDPTSLLHVLPAPSSPYDANPNIRKEFDACWESTSALFAGTSPRKNTGIHASWVQAWALHGYQFGPPLTQEYRSVDGNGNPLTVQQFAGARCEWDTNGVAHWYAATGPINF